MCGDGCASPEDYSSQPCGATPRHGGAAAKRVGYARPGKAETFPHIGAAQPPAVLIQLVNML
jgi:hypothetical protein